MGVTEPAKRRRGDPVRRGEERRVQEADRPRWPAGRRHTHGRHLEGGLSDASVRSRRPLPEERLSLLFDFGAPSQKVTIDEMPADMQVCNCNGVTKAAIEACVAAGHRTTKAVTDATRAGKGCGSCKSLVAEIVQWFCGGEVEEDPSIHYYVPGVPLAKPELIAAVRDKGLKSVSAVFKRAGWRRGGCGEQACAGVAARTIRNHEYQDERDARFINDRVHAQHPKGRHLLRHTRDAGRRLHARRTDADRPCRREIQGSPGQTDRRPAYRFGGHCEGSAARGVERSRHARRLGLG